jgi:hypothetical protein
MTMMIWSVREARMIVERILLAAGIPDGFVPAVRDGVLYAQAMGLDGLATLKRDIEALQSADPAALASTPDGALDGGGQHAFIVAPAALDLALAAFRRGEGDGIAVRDVAASDMLRVIEGLAGRHGATAMVEEGRVRVTADGRDGEDAVLMHALRHGMPAPRALWEELYAWSHAALTPDSIESRRHAGPVMVDAQGRVHGRDDDDTDFTLLGLAPAAEEA